MIGPRLISSWKPRQRIALDRLTTLPCIHTSAASAELERTSDGCAPGEPGMLRSGIYLGKGAERPAPARGSVIEDNEITGYKMRTRCIGYAPGVLPQWNSIRANQCRDR